MGKSIRIWEALTTGKDSINVELLELVQSVL